MEQPGISNPFLFLQPYDLKNTFSLKGRDDEAQVLLALLRWKDIVVVCGKSGIGKTSFINHTLSEKINPVNWLPVRITRLLDINESFKIRIKEALTAASVYQIHAGEIEEKAEGSENLFEKEEGVESDNPIELVQSLYLKWNRPIYLIIDQLEELFLIGDKTEQTAFLKTLRGLTEAPRIKKKIILVIREEHLKYMQEVERILKGVFQEALAIKEIKREAGGSIYDSLLQVSDAVDFGGRILPARSAIIKKCEEGDTFDAQKLQILLFLLWERTFDPEKPLPDADILPYVDQLLDAVNPLRTYIDKSVNEELSGNGRLLKAPYWWILRNTISDSYTKKPVSITSLYDLLVASSDDQLRLSRHKLEVWCQRLEGEKILERLSAAETGRDGEIYYQLRHDSLVPPIQSLDQYLPLRFPKIVPAEQRIRNPYRGLSQYDPKEEQKGRGTTTGDGIAAGIKDVSKLYGREAIIKEYMEFLLALGNRCLVIVGDSGTGKSSLVKGGLLPAIQAAGYRTKTIQPGADVDRLTTKIREFIQDETPPVSTPQKRCLYIDQFEECYTFRESTIEEKEKFDKFLEFLNGELEKDNDNFKLIISIRHDYAHEFDRKISDWRGYKKLLRYPNQDEIFDIIVGPAFDRGISFVPEDLPERIAADAANTSYFLPLLSFTMHTLYKYEIEQNPHVLDKDVELSLTAARYEQIGKIVTCLQNEFTKTYQRLPEELKALFPELMTRMIVIKDTIPKAQPLAVYRIDYAEPAKVDKCIQLLDKFVPRFLRIKKITLNGERQDCYEPIHDSLLIYCDEIREIVNTVQKPDSQMYLQPRIESAVREWRMALTALHKKEEEGTAVSMGENNRIVTEIIARRYKELEPLFPFVKRKATADNNWLFKAELELVTEGKKYAEVLQDTEELARIKKMQELELQQKQQELYEQKLKAEWLELKALHNERFASKARLRSRRQKWWIIGLSMFILICAPIRMKRKRN